MAAKRPSIPKGVSEKVLKEYRHLCAMCGKTQPHLHHIDEDPTNNVPENLIPLCPNCHLQDIHDPTAPIDKDKVRLFRRTKDPFVMDHRFHPLWTRMQFLRVPDDQLVYIWENYTRDLGLFVRSLKMGAYYKHAINGTLEDLFVIMSVELQGRGENISPEELAADKSRITEVDGYRRKLVEDLCVELLRYQDWTPIPK